MRTVLRYLLLTACLAVIACNAHGACTITTTGVSFGSYDTMSSTALDMNGQITVSCTNFLQIVVIEIGRSSHSGTFNPRQMRLNAGSDLMNYNLYTNAARSTIWGDGTGGTSRITRLVFRNNPLTLPVYGRIPAGQDISVGTYNDILIATVEY